MLEPVENEVPAKGLKDICDVSVGLCWRDFVLQFTLYKCDVINTATTPRFVLLEHHYYS